MKLRREKMEALKKELSEVGARIDAPDVDENQFTGMRRLRILHSRAMKASDAESVSKNPSSQNDDTHDTKTVRKVTIERTTDKDGSVKHKVTETTVEVRKALVAAEGGVWGMSRSATIGVFVGAAVFLLLLSYVVYKYMSWKPKMVARKGYKAVSKSKGLTVSETDEAAADSTSSGGVLRAPGLIVAGQH